MFFHRFLQCFKYLKEFMESETNKYILFSFFFIIHFLSIVMFIMNNK